MRHAVFFVNHDFPNGNSANAAIKVYLQSIKELGFQVQVLVAYSSKFNQNGNNTQTSGSFEGIPFKFLSGTVRYSPNLFFKIGLLFKTWVATFLSIKSLPKDTLLFFFHPRFHDFSMGLIVAKAFSFHSITLVGEQDSLLKKKGLIGFLIKKEEKIIAKKSSRVWCISPNLLSHYQKLQARKTSLMPAACVDMERFNVPLQNHSFKVGYLGSFAKKDGLPQLLAAFQLAKLQLPQLSLCLMGHGEVALKETEDIEYTGALNYEDIPKMLAKCDLLVANRTDSAFARTGFPIKLVEYLAVGIPIALVNFEEYHPYLNNKQVLYFEPDNVQSLADAIAKRYQNYEEFSNMGLKGREVAAKNFSKETVLQFFKTQLIEE